MGTEGPLGQPDWLRDISEAPAGDPRRLSGKPRRGQQPWGCSHVSDGLCSKPETITFVLWPLEHLLQSDEKVKTRAPACTAACHQRAALLMGLRGPFIQAFRGRGTKEVNRDSPTQQSANSWEQEHLKSISLEDWSAAHCVPITRHCGRAQPCSLKTAYLLILAPLALASFHLFCCLFIPSSV